MEHFLIALNILGYVSTVIVIGSVVLGVYRWCRGIAPVPLRLGIGLATNRIAVLAEGDEQTSLRNLLLDSGLFRKKNILEVVQSGDIERAANAALYVIHWPSWKDNLTETLAKKKETTGLVVYAPHAPGEEDRIPNEVMAKLNEYPNVTVTNFRGRLLSDILLSMMTRSCAK